MTGRTATDAGARVRARVTGCLLLLVLVTLSAAVGGLLVAAVVLQQPRLGGLALLCLAVLLYVIVGAP